MKKRNRTKPKNAAKKRNTQKAQSECINEYDKRIYQKYGIYLKNRSNPQETKRYQKPEFEKLKKSNYMSTSPIAAYVYRKQDKRYQCNTFGNV